MKETLEGFLEKLKLKHFKPKELMFRGAADEVLKINTEPPRDLWPNIVEAARLADEAREALGFPITVKSGYRNVAYNSRVGGAPNSQHLEFRALDLGCDEPRKLFDLLKRWRDKGRFKGGLGHYPTFVHLDTRGYNATW